MQVTNKYVVHSVAGGETFDSIALEYYTEEKMMHYIIKANPHYADVIIFQGGEQLKIPIVREIETPQTLPPWRR